MTKGKITLVSVVAAAIFAGGVLVGQVIPEPTVTVGSNHPNLQAAQQDIVQAFNQLAIAQKANNAQLGGYASAAGKLLDEANADVALAAQYADAHGR